MSGITGFIGKMLGYMLLFPTFHQLYRLNIYVMSGNFDLWLLAYIPLIFLTWLGWGFTTMVHGFCGIYDTGCVWIPFFGYLEFDLTEEEKENRGFYLD